VKAFQDLDRGADPPSREDRPEDTAGILEDFLRGRAPTTVAAYARGIAAFAEFAHAASPSDAARTLLAHGAGAANRLVLAYRAHLLDRGAAPATVNVRLSAVKSLVTFARTVGIVPWELSVRGVRSLPYRNVRGPGRNVLRQMLRESAGRGTTKSVRDHAVLRLLADLALRRAEVVSLDLADVDLAAGVVRVLGKGLRERVPITVPPETAGSLARWLALRGADAGALFVSLHRGGTLRRGPDGSLRRIAGADVYRLVRSASAAVGAGPVHPHAIRHASVSAALDATGGDVRRVQRFSRHASVAVLLRYDDARNDGAGDVARLVAAQLGSG
jgi:integrase/recombinase XerC